MLTSRHQAQDPPPPVRYKSIDGAVQPLRQRILEWRLGRPVLRPSWYSNLKRCGNIKINTPSFPPALMLSGENSFHCYCEKLFQCQGPYMPSSLWEPLRGTVLRRDQDGERDLCSGSYLGDHDIQWMTFPGTRTLGMTKKFQREEGSSCPHVSVGGLRCL